MLQEIFEYLEIVNSQTYKKFLEGLLNTFCETLESTPPEFEEGLNNSIRSHILKIFQKLPINEHLKTYLSTFLRTYPSLLL